MLAIISTNLPSALRTFLLTLAVVDDLLAILVIALVNTDQLGGAAAAGARTARAVHVPGAAAGVVVVAAAAPGPGLAIQ